MTRFSLRHLAVAIFAVAAVWDSIAASRAEDEAADKTIVFVCLHGVVNSQMAAAYFNKVAKERGNNKAAVALANKMARMVWAVWHHDRDYQPAAVTA